MRLHNTKSWRTKTLIFPPIFGDQDVNFPKFLEMDLPLFEGIIADLFPGRKRPVLDYGALNNVMKLVIQKKGLQPHPFFTTKVKQCKLTLGAAGEGEEGEG